MGEMSATQIAETIAAKFKAEGSKTSAPRGGNWRGDFIDVQLPNGQVFRISVEEMI
jgi:hypothetical protein